MNKQNKSKNSKPQSEEIMILENTKWSTMKKGEEFRCKLELENDKNDDTMFLVDELDDAIIGYTDSWNGASCDRRQFIAGRPHRAVYDHDRSYKLLRRNTGLSQDEAEQREWNDKQYFDIDEQYDEGENGPIFVKLFKRSNRNLNNGKDLRSQFEKVMANSLETVPIVDGLDDAIIGYTDSFMGMDFNEEVDEDSRAERPTRLVYDRDRCIEILKKTHATRRNKAEDIESIESEYLGSSMGLDVNSGHQTSSSCQ